MFESFTQKDYFCESSTADDVNIFTVMRKQASRILDDFILGVGSSIRKQNETLCTVMENFCQELDLCLIKVKSLPPTPFSIGLELRTVYNLLYTTAVKSWHLQHKPLDVLLSKAEIVLLSLRRVHEGLGVDKCTQENESQQPGTTQVEQVSFVLMSLLTSLKALDNKELGQEVGMLACMWSLLILLERDSVPFSSGLSVLSDWTFHGDEVVLKHGFQLMVASSSNVDETNTDGGSKPCGLVQNLSSLLLAVSCFHECRWKECQKVAFKVSDPQWRWFSILLTARALLADGNCMEAVGVLHSMLDVATDASSPVLSEAYRLLASCYSAQLLPRLSVVMLHRSLQIDPESTTALFMLAKQFQSLQQGNDEIECLQTLVKAALENSNRDWQYSGHPPLLDDLLQEVVVCPDRLSVTQALYHLAVRCEQLEKYEESSEAYEKLIHIYQKRESSPSHPHSPEVVVPDLLTVCRQAAEVFLKIPQYTQCLQLCDRTLSAISSSSSLTQSDFPLCQRFEDPRLTQTDESFTLSQGDISIDESDPVLPEFKWGRKRCISSSSVARCTVNRDETTDENRVLLMMYKAECLLAQGDNSTAVQILRRAFQGLMECRWKAGGQRLGEAGSESTQPECSASDPKRPHFCLSQVKDTVTKTPQPLKDEMEDRKLHQLSSRLCLYLADAFCRCSQHQQALHSARLAAQMEPENEDYQYFLNSILMALGRGQEEFQSWLLLRGLPHNTGSIHLHSTIQQRKDMIRSVSEDGIANERRLGTVTEKQKLELDLSSLELLVKSRAKR